MKKSILIFSFLIIVHCTLNIDNCMCQWVQNSGPYEGDIHSVCINGTYIFAGTSGLYLSTNNGSNWSITSLNKIIFSLAASGSNVFAGGYRYIYHSTNNGLSWTQATLNLLEVYSLAINGTNIFAGCQHLSIRPGGVWLSTDNGLTWNQTSLNNRTVRALAVSGNYVFAGTEESFGVYLSSNNGINWSQTSLNKPVHSLVIQGSNIFAGTDYGLYLSSDYGTSWSQKGFNGLRVLSLAVYGTNMFVGTLDSGLYISTNNGSNWTKVSLFNKKTVNSLAANSSCLLAGTTGYGIYLSIDNGSNWNLVGFPCKIASLTSSNEYKFAGTLTGIHRSFNDGLSWEKVFYNDEVILNNFLLDCNGSNIYAAGSAYEEEPICFLQYSTNNGTNWTRLSGHLGNYTSIVTGGSNIFLGYSYYSEGKIKYSTDNGITWNYYSLGSLVHSLAISGSNIFAGTTGNGVYLSTNNGTNWTQTSFKNRTIRSLAISDIYIFAGTDSNGLYFSSNLGATWAQTALNNQTVLSLAVSGQNVFAGTDNNGVYLSSNLGTNWIQKNEGFNGVSRINTLLIKNGYIFAGTNGQSVWSRPLTDMITGIKPITNRNPKDYALEQNYPNPFNSMTNVKFKMSNSEIAKITVFDLLGREVAVLVNEKLQAGTYEVSFEASDLPSGTYFYRLTAGAFTDTKKLILIK